MPLLDACRHVNEGSSNEERLRMRPSISMFTRSIRPELGPVVALCRYLRCCADATPVFSVRFYNFNIQLCIQISSYFNL